MEELIFTFIGVAIVGAFWAALVWIVISFVVWDIHPMAWSIAIRGVAGTAWAVVMLLTLSKRI